MPPRAVTVAIVVAWLAMSVWLFCKDLWPRLRPGEPPAYTISLSDEAPQQGGQARWKVTKNGEHAYFVETWIDYRERGEKRSDDDTFEMRALVRARQLPGHKAPLRRLHSMMRVTRDGELRAVNAKLHMVVARHWEIVLEIDGAVQSGRLTPRWLLKVYQADAGSEDRVFENLNAPPLPEPPARSKEQSFSALAFSGRGIILNPLHPPTRLESLRPGQRWRMPLFLNLVSLEGLSIALEQNRPEALGDVAGAVFVQLATALTSVPELEALVLPETELLPRAKDAPPLPGNKPPPACLVVEALDDDTQARIWVQHSDGTKKGVVLRQEVTLHGTKSDDIWVFEREP
jgi:hypothetical protein